MITFDLLPLHRVYEEIKPNLPRHYHELTEGDDYGPFDIDWEMYLHLSHLNKCLVVTVRDDKKLVGYSVYSVGRNPRYKTIIQACSDGIFLEKEYRGQLSRIFMKKADEYLRQIGVGETIYILSDDRVGRILGGNGYKAEHKVWRIKYE